MTQLDTYTEDYGADGFNPYEAIDDLGEDQPVEEAEDLEAEDLEAEEPVELEPDPIEERELELQRREVQLQEAAENQQLQEELRGYYQQQLQTHARVLSQQGYYAEQIEFLAKNAAQQDLEKAAYQVLNKRNLEKLVSMETGIPRERLKNFWDEASMRAEAESYKRSGGPEAKKVADLERRLARAEAALKRQGVPGQRYNQPGSSAGRGTDADLIRRYANGEINMSPRVRRALDR